MAKEYVGLQKQISRNNRSCVIMLLSFPAIVLGLIYAACYVWAFSEQLNSLVAIPWKAHAFEYFTKVGPIAFLCILAWFLIAYFYNVSIISYSTGARSIERKENKRLYNLIENLCVATGTSMPKVQIIDVPTMNAYASGINESTYTIALTQGIIDNLDRKSSWTEANDAPADQLLINHQRIGEVPGTHQVEYRSSVDRIFIEHEAFSREGFALGAVVAAEWMLGKKGFHTMDEIMNF